MTADPRGTYRAVSGVVMTALLVTFSASLLAAEPDEPVDAGIGILREGVVEVLVGALQREDVAPLLEPGVVTVHSATGSSLVTSCDALARVVVLTCDPPAWPPGFGTWDGLEIDHLPVTALLIPTDGTPAAEGRVRNEAARVVPNAIIHTQADRIDTDASFLTDLGRLFRLAWQFDLVIAACALTVGMAAGIVERRRPFALLRASGLHLGELRRIVLLETAAAMVVTAAAGVALGLASSLALAWGTDAHWAWPDPGIFTMIGAGVLAALVLTALTLPIVDATTRHDTVRYS
jgi:hypothetical protein